MKLNPELLSILVCPSCKGELEPIDDERYLRCSPCELKYPVLDGIPVMLSDEAEPAGKG